MLLNPMEIGFMDFYQEVVLQKVMLLNLMEKCPIRAYSKK